MSRYKYERRKSLRVPVGNTAIGGNEAVRVQSMTNTPTLDTEASVAQTISLAKAGAELVRLTAQGVNHARNLGEIRRKVREAGIDVPLVADIHFNPAAAFAAAEEVEKVRINPGNFVDPGRTFKSLSYTDEEYAAELQRIEEKLVPFLELCKSRGTAIRLGVNHGSLSDRIMSRYGDTPAGMVESAMEFLRVCRKYGFDNVVISIKASNVTVMTQTVRMLVEAMDAEDMHYPLHLGVTEAGDGEDARVKSAAGIGSLLADGLGDTIRVSLSEAPEAEIPVARTLLKHIERMADASPVTTTEPSHKPAYGTFRETHAAGIIGGGQLPVVVGLDIQETEIPAEVAVIEASGNNRVAEFRVALDSLDEQRPAILRAVYPAEMNPEEVTIAASVDLGALLLEGARDGIWIDAPSLSAEARNNLALSILQATRTRMSKTEFIACPGCGRTLFPLPDVLARIKAACAHLTGLKIGVMGCIVNGPGEMADADYGYVGAAAGMVSLYRNKECVRKNIPAAEAVDELIALIKSDGRWIEPTK